MKKFKTCLALFIAGLFIFTACGSEEPAKPEESVEILDKAGSGETVLGRFVVLVETDSFSDVHGISKTYICYDPDTLIEYIVVYNESYYNNGVSTISPYYVRNNEGGAEIGIYWEGMDGE